MAMTNSPIFDRLTQLIESYIQEHKESPQKILIGYKAYYDLMGNTSFAEEVTNSALDPNKRKYQKIKIKITKDDYQLELD
jgi:penicillin V acylase-like amidase (Ntn superfamily)